jgi:hypothetical protein
MQLISKQSNTFECAYRVQSPVSLSIFREFLSALKGNAITITDTNFTELHQLCEEFGFSEIAAKLSKFSKQSDYSLIGQINSSLTGMRSAELRDSFEFVVNGTMIELEIADSLIFPAIREQLSVDGCAQKFFVNSSGIEAADIRSLQLLLSGETVSIGRSQGLLSGFLGNVTLERLFLDCSKADIRMNLSDLLKERRIDLEFADVSVLSVEALDSLLLSEFVRVESEDSLLRFILKLDSGYRDLLRHIQIGFLSEDGLHILDEHFGMPPESVWHSAAERITSPLPPPFDSRIISDFPEIFAEFQRKNFKILWRGSRDGFEAKDFHRRCDGHANTLTVILDTQGNIFGGFTPVEWESGSPRSWREFSNGFKTDDSLKSFLFTLKNPHNIPARRFALKAEEKDRAIECDSESGPCFGGRGHRDMCALNNYMGSYNNFTNLGNAYVNDVRLGGEKVFTGSRYFKVTEIEVFEITD